jgi:hypothetical protein
MALPVAQSCICATLLRLLAPSTPEKGEEEEEEEWRDVHTDVAATAAAVSLHVAGASLARRAARSLASQLQRAAEGDASEDFMNVIANIAEGGARGLDAYAAISAHCAAHPHVGDAECAVVVAHSAAELATLMNGSVSKALAAKSSSSSCDDVSGGGATWCELRGAVHAAACRATTALLAAQPALATADESVAVACMRVAAAAMLNSEDASSSDGDASQAAACVLLTHLAFACGGGEAMHRLLARASAVSAADAHASASHEQPMPIAALLTACALQAGKPAARRAARRALALLLAMQLVAQHTNGGESR